jgi:hypothetical protein
MWLKNVFHRPVGREPTQVVGEKWQSADEALLLARDSVENNSYFRDAVRIEVVDSNGEVLAEWNRSATGL